MQPYTIERNGNLCEVRLAGDLTAASVPALQVDLRQNLPPEIREIRFDLNGVAMLDSSGIGLLIASSNSIAARQGRLSVVGASPDIYQLLQSMRLTTRLNVSARPA